MCQVPEQNITSCLTCNHTPHHNTRKQWNILQRENGTPSWYRSCCNMRPDTSSFRFEGSAVGQEEQPTLLACCCRSAHIRCCRTWCYCPNMLCHMVQDLLDSHMNDALTHHQTHHFGPHSQHNQKADGQRQQQAGRKIKPTAGEIETKQGVGRRKASPNRTLPGRPKIWMR